MNLNNNIRPDPNDPSRPALNTLDSHNIISGDLEDIGQLFRLGQVYPVAGFQVLLVDLTSARANRCNVYVLNRNIDPENVASIDEQRPVAKFLAQGICRAICKGTGLIVTDRNFEESYFGIRVRLYPAVVEAQEQAWRAVFLFGMGCGPDNGTEKISGATHENKTPHQILENFAGSLTREELDRKYSVSLRIIRERRAMERAALEQERAYWRESRATSQVEDIHGVCVEAFRALIGANGDGAMSLEDNFPEKVRAALISAYIEKFKREAD